MRYTTIFLLFFLGVSAMFGGWGLFMDPSGRGVGMPLEVLTPSPFTDFFIPGLILFLILGIGSIITLVLYLRKISISYWGVMLEGVASLIWIITQYIMIQMFSWLQVLYAAIGVALLLLGWLQYRKRSSVYTKPILH